MTLAAIIFASLSVGAMIGFVTAAVLQAGARADREIDRDRPMTAAELEAAGVKIPDWYRGTVG